MNQHAASPLPGGPASGYRWVVLAAATAAQASTSLVTQGIGALAGFIQEGFGLTGAQTGLVAAAIGAAPLAAMLPVGRLLDRYGERIIVPAGAVTLAAGVAAAAAAESYPTLLLLLFLAGAGYTTSQPGGSKAVAGWFPGRQRGLAMGIRQTGLPAGGAVAAALLPALAVALGWRAALLAAAAGALAGGLLFGLVYREPPDRNGPEKGYAFLGQVQHLLREPGLRPVLGSGLALVSAQFVIGSYLMLFLRDRHAIPLSTGAWLLTTAQAAGVAGRVVLAAWSDRRGGPGRRMLPVAASLLCAAAAAAVLPLLPGGTPLPLLVAVAGGFGFFAFGWYGPWVVHVAEVAPPEAVGLTLSLVMAVNQLAIILAPPLFGLGLDLAGGYTLPWLTLAALLAATGAWVWRRS